MSSAHKCNFSRKQLHPTGDIFRVHTAAGSSLMKGPGLSTQKVLWILHILTGSLCSTQRWQTSWTHSYWPSLVCLRSSGRGLGQWRIYIYIYLRSKKLKASHKANTQQMVSGFGGCHHVPTFFPIKRDVSQVSARQLHEESPNASSALQCSKRGWRDVT